MKAKRIEIPENNFPLPIPFGYLQGEICLNADELVFLVFLSVIAYNVVKRTGIGILCIITCLGRIVFSRS